VTRRLSCGVTDTLHTAPSLHGQLADPRVKEWLFRLFASDSVVPGIEGVQVTTCSWNGLSIKPPVKPSRRTRAACYYAQMLGDFLQLAELGDTHTGTPDGPEQQILPALPAVGHGLQSAAVQPPVPPPSPEA
jgi:hypothetical protein